MGDERDQFLHPDDHVGGGAVLNDLPVNRRRDLQVVDVKLRVDGDPGAQRAGRVEALAARPLAVLVHHVAGRQVVADRVAEDDVDNFAHRNVLGQRLDDDSEFALGEDPLGPLRQHDGIAGSNHRRVGLDEQDRVAGVLDPFRARRVPVLPDANDLGPRDHRRQQPDLVQLKDLPTRIHLAEQGVAPQHEDPRGVILH